MAPRCRFDVSRREFVQATGGALTGWAILSEGEWAWAASSGGITPLYPKNRAQVALVFCRDKVARTTPSTARRQTERAELVTLIVTKACPRIDFTVQTVWSAEEARAMLAVGQSKDGFVVVPMEQAEGTAAVIARSGRPVTWIRDRHANAESVAIEGELSETSLPVALVTTADWQDVLSAIWPYRTVRALKETTILAISSRPDEAAVDSARNLFGARLAVASGPEIAAIYRTTDAREAEELAHHWIKGARRTEDASREAVVASARTYLALARAMADRRADAIAIDCSALTGTDSGLPYPCLSHFQMNNDGSTAVCRCDLNAVCGQLIARYITGHPGFLCEHVRRTDGGDLILAHTACTNRLLGPQRDASAYIIRRQYVPEGALTVQSLLPMNVPLTLLAVDTTSGRLNAREVRTRANLSVPMGCRSQIQVRTAAGDLALTHPATAPHVAVFGEWSRQTTHLARLLNLRTHDKAVLT